MPPPSDLSLTIQRGTTFQAFLQFVTASTNEAIDITGWTFIGAQLRQGIGDDADLLADFTITVTDAEAGTIRLSLTASQTEALTAQDGTSAVLDTAAPRWDVLYTDDDGVTSRFPQDSPGIARICDGVTQA